MKVESFALPFWTRVRFPPSPPVRKKRRPLWLAVFAMRRSRGGREPSKSGFVRERSDRLAKRLPAISTNI